MDRTLMVVALWLTRPAVVDPVAVVEAALAVAVVDAEAAVEASAVAVEVVEATGEVCKFSFVGPMVCSSTKVEITVCIFKAFQHMQV